MHIPKTCASARAVAVGHGVAATGAAVVAVAVAAGAGSFDLVASAVLASLLGGRGGRWGGRGGRGRKAAAAASTALHRPLEVIIVTAAAEFAQSRACVTIDAGRGVVIDA